MNPTFHLQWMKNKTSHLLERFQIIIISLRKRDYNSKIASKLIIRLLVLSAKKYSKFDIFLQLDENFAIFNIAALINQYYDYYCNHLTAFAECPNVVI